MLKQLLANADSNDTGSVSTEIIDEAKKRDWEFDPYFKGVLDTTETESNNLLAITGDVRKLTFTQSLKDMDKKFDRNFLYSKNLAVAFTYSPVELTAKNASIIMDKFDAHNNQLYRLGYGKQIYLTKSLVEDFKEENLKAIVDSIPVFAESLVELEKINNELDAIYKLSKDEKSAIDDLLPASKQKNVVMDLINDEILPYLNVMSKKDPEHFEEFAQLVFTYIDDANTAIRSRMTKSEKEKEVPQE
ncbi:DUF6261 family protein [Marinifilum fragile]|uniref:DUF6261 family protein n=1 Tax=Marinifilum fragile TaxID=570161 RepID=UPI002AAAF02F|nr:DUF6261 family protein [Marinifilum fragile]